MGCASRRLTVPVAGLLLALLTGAAPAGNPAAPVAMAAGDPSRLHVHAQTTRPLDGGRETIDLDVADTRRLERTCMAGLCTGTWFDGRQQSRFGINGTPLPESAAGDASERTFAAIASTAFGEAGFGAAGGTVVMLPDRRDGLLRFRVSAPEGAELVAVADAVTRRLLSVETPEGTPFRSLVATVGAGIVLYADRAYDRVTIAAADDPLVPPAGPAVSVIDSGRLDAQSPLLPIVPCRVEQRAARCLLDSGTSPSAVTLGFAEALDREPHGRIEIAGLTTYTTGVVDAGPVTLGGARFERLALAVIPASRIDTFDVILGADVLAELRLTVDAARHQIGVASSERATGGTAIPLTFRDGVPYLDVRLAGRDRSEAMLLDTGDAGTLSIGYDEYRDHPETFEVRAAGAASGAAGPATSALEGVVAHATIGGEANDALPISAVRGQHVGHVGYGFAARCAPFVLDLGRRRAECVPKQSPPASNTSYRRGE